jgi:iron complex outermembrane receptor protein
MPAFKRSALMVVIACFLGAPAIAQSQTQSSSGPSNGPEEVVVTAQRQQQQERYVPITMTAISPLKMEDAHLVSLESIGAVTPGLVFEAGNGFPQSYIRGVGANYVTPGLENPVALYVDGAYVPRGAGTFFGLMDMGSVEVLKGPQGTLYGRNATGGAILMNTADPTDEYSVRATAEYGSFDHFLGEAVVNVPVSDTFSLRFAGRYYTDGGYQKDVTTGDHLKGDHGGDIRGKALWTPNEAFSALLTVEYLRDNSNSLSDGRTSSPPPLCAACGIPGGNANVGFYQTASDFEAPYISHSFSANLNLKYHIGDLNFQSVTAYRDLFGTTSEDNDMSALPLFVFQSGFGGKTFSEDAQVSSAYTGWLNFLAGLQYIHDDASDFAHLMGLGLGIPYGNTPARTDQGVTTKSFAAFAELYIKPMERMTITLGGRYSSDDRSIDTMINPVAQAIFNPAGTPNFSQKVSYTKFTPRAVVAYDTGNTNLYASYTQGFRAGGFNTPSFAPQAAPINPETINSYEVGAKFVSDDERLHLNLAAFKYDYKDVQVTAVDVTTGGQIINNAGAAEGKGGEADVAYAASDWLTLSGGLAYLDAYYTNYPNALIYVETPVGYATQFADLKGKPLPRSPRWSGYVGANFITPLGDALGGYTFRLAPTLHFSSKYDFYPDAGGQSQADRQKSLALFDVTGGFQPPSGNYEIGFYVNNAFGEKYYTSISTGSFGADQFVAKPRTYGVRISANF